MPHTPDELLTYLAGLGIATETVDHEPVFTVEESRHLRGQIAGAHTKNLFLRDNKKNFFLVTLDEGMKVDLKQLRSVIGGKGGLSFGAPETLLEHLGILPGSVSPFALYNDAARAVTFAIGADLLEADMINCHPLINSKTTTIKPANLLAFLRATGHEPIVVPVDGTDPAGQS